MRILLTGASGLFGLNFALHHAAEHAITGVVNHHRLADTPFTLRQADLAEPGSAAALVEELRPELIINCAALANLDACEKHPQLAETLNANLPAELAQAAALGGAKLVHFSTDAVFDGLCGDYSETDPPNPINVYSRTKMMGEQAVLQANPRALVVRVNFYGFSLAGQRSLAEFFIYNLAAERAVAGFTDVYFCPLHAVQLGQLLMHMVRLDLAGLYHTVSSQALSKYDFGVRIARRFGLDETLIQPRSWRAGGLEAARSPRLTLRTDKLAAALGAPPPETDSGIQILLDEFRAGLPLRLQGYADF